MRNLLPLLALGCLTGCGVAQSSPQPATSPFAATAVGRIDSAEESRQLVAAADGVIAQLFVTRGQQVRKGQALLAVDCAPRDQTVGVRSAAMSQASAAALTVSEGARSEEITAAEAQYTAATALREDASDRLTRTRGLIDQGFITKREVEARENALTAARAEAAAAAAKLSMLRKGSRASEIAEANAAARAAAAETGVARALADQCTLRSPVDGTILQILRREGEFSGASQGTPLLLVGDLSNMIVRAEISERDAVNVKQGKRALIWIDGQPTKWKGHVTHLASIMGRRSARSLDPTDRFDRDVREVFISFDGAPPPALVGLRVTVGLLK